MHARRRVLKLVSATAAAVLSGGVAWAAASVPVPTVARVHEAAESTTSSTEPPTTVEATTTTVEETPTTVEETPTTVAETPTPTTLPETPKKPEACKPGWGHGDTNHCHSGPPGLSQQHGHDEQGHHEHGHETSDREHQSHEKPSHGQHGREQQGHRKG